MTHEEKLDYMLERFMKIKLPYNDKQQEAALYNFMENKFPIQEASHLVSKLLRDEYILIESGAIPMLVITIDGQTFLRDGGYAAEKKREHELYYHTKESLRISKKNTNWVIIGAVAAIIAAALACISVFFK